MSAAGPQKPGTPVRLGIVGCGGITRSMHLPIVANLPGVRLEYIADLTPPRSVARDFGAVALGRETPVSSLPGCDLAFLSVPVGARQAYVEEFGRRGTALFTEKPFALDEAQHRHFLGCAKVVSCNYMRTTYSAVDQVRRIMQSGILGAPRQVVLSEGGIVGATGLETDHYRTDAGRSGGGILIERGVHGLSVLVHAMPDYAWTVEAASVRRQHGLDVDVDAALLGQRDDRRVTAQFKLTLIDPVRNEARFICEHGEARFDHTDPASRLTIVHEPSATRLAVEEDRTRARSVVQAFFLKWRRAVELAGPAVIVDGAVETSLATTRLVDAIYLAGRR